MKEQASQFNATLQLAISISVIFTFFLCFIDEGNYNLQWMLNFGNWVVFLLYSIIFTIVQLLIYWLLISANSAPFIKLSRTAIHSIMIAIGISMGLYICFQLFTAA